jgi:hypothetical protein
MIGARRRAAIFKGTDLPVGTAEAYFLHPEKHLACALQFWLRYVDELKPFLRREYSQSLHGATSKSFEPWG